MEPLDELRYVLEVTKSLAFKDSNEPPIPIFSFEGLPGAGKTTQIELVSNAVERKFGKSCYIDLPTSSSIGKILKMLYKDEREWGELRREAPWLNPLMISTDLRLAVDSAITNGAQYAFMSRGILSTYYYNLDAYGIDENLAWDQMSDHMKAFYRPTAIIFMDIDEALAAKRVILRNREPLRKMDQVDEMRRDRIRLQKYLDKLNDIPVHYINADGEKDAVTKRIIEVVERYLISDGENCIRSI